MVAAVAPYIDAGISKTLNLHPDYPREYLPGLFLRAWRLGLKGLAVFRPSAARSGVLSSGSETEACEPAAGPDPEPQSGPRCPRCDPL
jgi:ribonucleoside-diphosphate reductase alpha chain